MARSPRCSCGPPASGRRPAPALAVARQPARAGRPATPARFAELLARCLAGVPPIPARRSRIEEREASPRGLAGAPELAANATLPVLPPESGALLEPCPPAAGGPMPAARSPAAELQELADQILRRVSLVALPSEVALQLELQAPLLRQVAVELRLCRGRLRARLQASDRAGFDRLRSAIPELEAALSARGLAPDRVELELGRR